MDKCYLPYIFLWVFFLNITNIFANPFQVEGMREVILIGFYQPNDALNRFISQAQSQFKIQIRLVFYKNVTVVTFIFDGVKK